MRIFYAQESDPMIAASLSELKSIVEEIGAYLVSAQHDLLIPAITNESASPYEELLTGLRLKKTSEPIRIVIEPERSLCVTGSVEDLRLWAEAFHFPDSSKEGDHHHPECRDGIRIQKGSLSTIVEIYEPV